MKTKSIGIIDSGLGGYTIFKALRDEYPEVSFTLLADQKNNPFGSKSVEQLELIGSRMVDQLLERNINEVIVACNTLNANVMDYLETKYPQVSFYGVIDKTVESLPKKCKTVLILATEATAKSHAYQSAITKVNSKAWVDELAAPQLVDLIEGLADDVDIDAMLEDLLASRNKVDAIVMGCTHFPIIAGNIRKFSKAALVTSIEPMIQLIAEMKELPQGKSYVFTTYDPVRMANQIETLFSEKIFVDYLEGEAV